VAYVVNELSSTVAVFEVDRALLQEIKQASARGDDMTKYRGRSTLRLIQSIKTLPPAFPPSLNTCGRICVHQTGRFVVVSNRGHQSIAIFRVLMKGPRRGELAVVGHFHTRGETPRHFQFDSTGQYLLVANQDSDQLAVFNFNLSSGHITYTGNEYKVASPNFVCCMPVHADGYESDGDNNEPASGAAQLVDVRLYRRGEADAPVSAESSDSETSAHCRVVPPTHKKNTPSRHLLEAELARARQEIEELKRQLAGLST
jgi:hypothetical protein